MKLYDFLTYQKEPLERNRMYLSTCSGLEALIIKISLMIRIVVD